MMSDISVLLGQTLVKVAQEGNKRLTFHTADREWAMFHSQDCCEHVAIEDVAGDLTDLVGTPILIAEEVTSENVTPEGCPPLEYEDSYTWTFYKLATVKGHVTIRWLGESNGYYSECVSFEEVTQ